MNLKPPSKAHEAAAFIRQRMASSFKPRLGIVLGSGLGELTQSLKDSVSISYNELPGFPILTVEGHAGQLVCGTLNGLDVVCLQGRAHAYEGQNNDTVLTYIRTLRLLGCDYLLATNAAGSLCVDVGPGELMLITDHINLQPSNPLIGPNDNEFGPRFYPLDQAYHPELRKYLLDAAEQAQIPLHSGVYLSVLGPHFETAAEIRAFRIWGADAVGMSTVPEVLVANHCGMQVAVISVITNHATGLAKSSHSHVEVVKTASLAAKRLNRLIQGFVRALI